MPRPRRKLRYLRSILVLISGLWAAACCTVQPQLGTSGISGQVVDPQGTPLAGVRVVAEGATPVTTDRLGEFRLMGARVSPRLAVSFSAPGFVRTTRVIPTAVAATRVNVIVIWPRAKPVAIDVASGGQIPFANGGAVTLPPNALVDEKGQALTGTANVSLTYLDVSDPTQLRAVSGDFTAKMRDGSQRRLESFGVFEIFVADSAGRRAELARGRTAGVQIPIPRRFLERAPERINSFSFDPKAGVWMEESPLVLNGPVYSGTISQFDWSWNADDPLDTTCMIFEAILDTGVGSPTPWPGCLVEAEGVSYGSISSGYTDSNGLVCLLVKLNEQVSVGVHGCGSYPNYHSPQPVVLNSPSTPATCGGGTCTQYKIPFDIITGGPRKNER